jgi:hypothetical protein
VPCRRRDTPTRRPPTSKASSPMAIGLAVSLPVTGSVPVVAPPPTVLPGLVVLVTPVAEGVVDAVTGLVVGVVTGGVLLKKLLVMVAVHVTVLAPAGPDALHWVIVIGSPVDCDSGAVAVQVIVPPGPPEPSHWTTLCPPGPPEPARSLPAGVATQVSVFTVPGLWHCLIVEAIAEPVGYPVRLLVTVPVQVTVLAPPRPAVLHWVMLVTGVVDVVVPPVGHTADPVQCTVVTMTAAPVG